MHTMNYFTDHNMEATSIVPQYSDIICIEHGALESESKHFIINHPGTDLFIDILHSFKDFFDSLPLERQLILCGCIVDGLAYIPSSPARFFSLSRNNEWTQVSSGDAVDMTYLALKYGLGNVNSLSLGYQMENHENSSQDTRFRSVRPPPPQCHQAPLADIAANGALDHCNVATMQQHPQNDLECYQTE
eukprot:15089968-Ditylum_brightwellii.AAC.1